ncbi:unnamed protein product [Rotaria sp. Silwood1]|nr:unnamed protein product [Rotaria sp. Silwood1]CAF3698582.1 unnamed protein product [Rotaria sp. Silwood1]CAF3728807.1 unnamed protein product [Rotaria sp. Silwood1]CAF4910221.1 unnamed protein product [Rotaria sp. Silwood1]CAF4961103.1 unnamed protein product [Rotaria sp. Silwood1]
MPTQLTIVGSFILDDDCYIRDSDKSRFQLKNIIYSSSNLSLTTTVPSNIGKHFFYPNKIDSLVVDTDKFIIPPIHGFTSVKSLILCSSVLMS